MLTVPEAARRVGRNPETVRRWIRAGRLRSTKVGTQHLIDEEDLEAVAAPAATNKLPVPREWQRTYWGGPMPDWLAILDEVRSER